MKGYKVSALFHGKRILTDKIFRKKSTAQIYANKTNKSRRNVNARVVKYKMGL
jgi:hypothetical protein